MPELPEVETTVRDLRPQLVGRTIRRAAVTWQRTIAHPSAAVFTREIVGCRITAITRRGKFLVFHLHRGARSTQTASARREANKFLLVHLRMTGQFGLHPPRVKRDKHQHVHLLLDNGRELRFHDFRKFGRWWLVDNPDHIVSQLGPEPLEMSRAEFLERLRQRRGHIKPLLMNQTFIAGVGNIYADEALWYARIHPLKDARTITDRQAADLYRGIRRVLTKAIRLGGTSFDSTYRRINGASGEFQEDLRVVGRAGEPCYRCRTPIVKTVVGQRGTYYCPNCQT